VSATADRSRLEGTVAWSEMRVVRISFMRFLKAGWARVLEMLAGESPQPVGRNEACPCGGGRKYKRCCLDRDAALLRDEHLAQRLGRENKIVGRAGAASDAFDRMNGYRPPKP
jgi:hypothetical protein